MRALASYWLGTRSAIATPTMPASQAAISAIQRNLHIPLRTLVAWVTSSPIAFGAFDVDAMCVSGKTRPRRATGRLEEALRDDQDVTGAHVDVGRHVTALDEVAQPHRVLSGARSDPQDRRAVAGREVGQAADGDH